MSTMDQEARRNVTPALSTPGGPPVLVGRESELAVLSNTLDRAFGGNSAVLLVSGEAGIGKTSLVHRVVDQASEDGAVVLSGAAYDLSITPPYGPWLDLISRYQPTDTLPPLPSLLADPQQLNELDSPATLDSTMTSFLHDLAASAPLVVVLEDLHWSDQASLDMLRFVARSIRGLRILLTLTYRDDELTREHPLYLTLPSLVRETQAVRLNLQRLSQGEIFTLVADSYAMTAADTDRLACHLHRLTDGNPLFVQEMLRQLELDGTLEPAVGGWRLGEINDQAVPELIQQMVTARIARVRHSTAEAIQIAAVFGQHVPVPAWERFLTSEMRDSALDEALQTGLLNVASQSVSFSHALVREAVYAMIPISKRRQMHLSVAEYFLEQSNPDPDVVAFHLREADDERAAEWLIRSGEQADQRFASHEAFARFSDALVALDQVPESEPTRAGLLLKMARSLRFIDPVRGNEYLRMAYETAWASGEQAIAATALFNHGNNLCNLAEVQRGLGFMQHAIAIMREIPDEVVEIQRWTHNVPVKIDPLDAMNGTLALMLATTGRFNACVTTAERLIDFDWRDLARPSEIAEDESSEYLGVNGLYGLGIALGALGKPADSKLAFSRTDEFLAGINYQPYRVLVASNELLSYHFPYDTANLAERQRLAGLIEDHLDISEGLVGHQNALWGYEHYLLHSGRWHDLRTLIETNEPSNLLDYWFTSLSARARLAWYEGNIERARNIIAKLLINGPQTPPEEQTFFVPAEPHRIAAGIAIDDEDIDLARDWMVAHDHWLDWSEAVQGRAEGLLLWSRIHLAEHNTDRAQEIAEQAGQRAEVPRQPMALLAIHRFLGELATANADVDAADDHLHSSLRLAESCQLPFERALTLLSLAELEIARGNDERALTMLSESIRISTELGARRSLQRARQLEETLGANRKHFSYGLSAREVEVLSYIVEGMTDRQIAERLYISHRTVMRHVTSILRKLEVDSRTAAAAIAVRDHLI